MNFSVIIPTYNVVRYVRDCVQSAIDQRFDGRHEVLVIDDGSTDGTVDVVREFAARHRNVTAIFQANDGAPGKARNRGIEAARGEYLVFLDGDDRLPSDTLHFYWQVAGEKAPCLIAGARRILDEAAAVTSVRELPPTCLGDFAVPDRLDLRLRSLFHNASGKAFRHAVVAEHGVRFPEGHPGQDTAFSLHFLAVARRVYGENRLVYDVRVRADERNPSLTQQFDARAVERRLATARQCVDTLLDRGMVEHAADVHAYFLLGMFARVMREYRAGRTADLDQVFAHLNAYRRSRAESLTTQRMGRELRRSWRLLGPVLAGPRRFRLALWAIRALGLR